MNKYENFINKTIKWLNDYLIKNNVKNIVIGVSGGIDSAVSLCILSKLKNITIYPYFIDINSSKQSIIDAKEIANHCGININLVNLKKVYKSFSKFSDNNSKIQLGNLKVRIRMTFLYDQAYSKKALVVGNSNYDELFLGYYTKHGDNAVDLMLLNNLLKSEVYDLAKYLNIPENLITKKPSADLYDNQFDEHEMGVSYQEIDDFLLGKTISNENKNKIIYLSTLNQHKKNIIKNPNKISFNKNK